MSETLNQLALRLLEQKQHKHLLRARCAVEPIDATHVRIDGKRYINFASNDYLGLSHHPRMVEMLQKVASVGAGAAPLITGYSSVHAAAEADLAKWKKTESALLLPSGYQANTAAVQTLAALCEAMGRPVRFLVDKLAHASLIDAVRASGVAMRVFPHNGVAKLDRLLTDAASGELQVVVTESIFSMDGDAADLAALAQLKQRHDFVLLLDEAHGSGVYGRDGAGYASEAGFDTLTDITIVTLSKALGLSGGAICSSRAFIGAVENLGRAYIFSTAVAPATAALTTCALQILRDEPQRQARLRHHAQQVRKALQESGHSVVSGTSPIIPLILGSESTTIAASQALGEAGLLVAPVRPPTVAPGTSRLRITLSAEHTEEEISLLIKGVKSLPRVTFA